MMNMQAAVMRDEAAWTLNTLSERAAAQFGSRTALVCGDRHLSFEELDDLAARVGGALQTLGVGAGDRVTLCSVNCWEWVVSYYAVLKIGAVINPINAMLTPPEIAFVTGDCGARLMIASHDKARELLAHETQIAAGNIVTFGDGGEGLIGFAALLEHAPLAATTALPDPDDVCTICYTSGTTGHPKGAMLSHRNILASTAMTSLMHVRTSDDTVVSALPCSHVYGNVVLNAALRFGMKLVLLARFSEEAVLAAIASHKATMFEGVPTMFMYLLAHPARHRYDLSSLRKCTVGGQTMPVAKIEAVEAAFGCPLLELWGMTEVAGPAITHPLYGANRHGSIGIALPGTECRIGDASDPGVTMAVGEVGELLVRGPLVMRGYYGDPRATAEAIGADGWLRTGDLARVDADGYFFIVDRKKDMVITGGYNVYPAELERVIAAHPDVAMVAVGGRPDPLKGEVAKAYVVLNATAGASEEDILAYCRAHLAAYKVPRSVQFVADLPKTSTGKVLRRALAALDRDMTVTPP
jgi:long-chain acyl-CoA synthetase